MKNKFSQVFISIFIVSILIAILSVGVQATPGWSQTYGGTGYDSTSALVLTKDGGYALAGFTTTYGVNGDLWLIKTDDAGKALWNKTYGGSGAEVGNALIADASGSYVIVGYTSAGPAGGTDALVVKTDSNGNMVWNKTFGGIGYDTANAVVQAPGGGVVFAGYTNSSGTGVSDFWLVNLDGQGNIQWNQTYGSTGASRANALVTTNDGGYAIAGSTRDTSSSTSMFWMIKTDSNGIEQWNATYSGPSGSSNARAIATTSDGGYVLAGQTNSMTTFNGNFWLVKTDSQGKMVWNKVYGGSNEDDETQAVLAKNDGYIIAGSTNGLGAGSYDAWLAKTDLSGNLLWNQTYGGKGGEAALSLVATNDGGYAFAGYTTSFGAGDYDAWLVKTDGNGVIPELTVTTVLALLALLLISTFVAVQVRKRQKRQRKT